MTQTLNAEAVIAQNPPCLPAGWGATRRSTLSRALLAALGLATPVLLSGTALAAEEALFDLQMLKLRGVDPTVAELFRRAPRFLAGESTVSLTVNGKSRGKMNARFDEEGQPCVNADFVRQAGLVTPPGFNNDTACFDLKTAWPQTELSLDPASGSISLVLPQQAIAMTNAAGGNWQHGGVAGLLNYEMQYTDTLGVGAGLNYMQVGTETGFNVSDWIVRSRQTFSRLNGKDSLLHQNAYAQRSFSDAKKVLQAGQVSLSNSLFGTGQVLGFQLFPEAALTANDGGPALVEGIADSQSVVEVRQSGALVYRTTVPAGPYRLRGVTLLNTRSDLNVTVTGSDGGKRAFVVPAASLQLNRRVAPGLSFGAGKLEQQSSSKAPLVATLASGWSLGSSASLNAGLLGSSLYSAAGISLDSQPFQSTLLTLQTTVARDASYGNAGASAVVTLAYQATERVSFSTNASQQTRGYRELSDALQDQPTDTSHGSRNQFGAGIGWNQQTLGSLSLSVARSVSYDDSKTDYVRGSWSKQLGGAYLGAGIEQNTGTRDSEGETRIYLNLSLPLATGRSVNSYYNSSGSSSRTGLRYNDRSWRNGGWSLSGDRDLNGKRTSTSFYADRLTSLSQLSGGLNHSSAGSTSWTARAAGGIVVHAGGVSMSPSRVSDTFGIAKVGNVAGIRLDTPAGPSWTGRNGYAVLPTLNGFRRSTIQIDTRSLDKNIDVQNAFQETDAARGSVNYVNFSVVRTRRVLADIRDSQGKVLPRGASVFDAADNFVTVVDEKGGVFIPDAGAGNRFDVQVSGEILCSFTLAESGKALENALFETVSAQCR